MLEIVIIGHDLHPWELHPSVPYIILRKISQDYVYFMLIGDVEVVGDVVGEGYLDYRPNCLHDRG